MAAVARAVVLAMLVLLAPACAGGGDDRLSHSELVREANGICARYQKRFDALPQPRNLREFRRYMAKAIPLARREVRDLSRLEPPAEDERAFEQLLANAEQTVDAAERLRRAAADASQAELELLFEHARQLGAEGDAIARRLGLRRCIDRV